MFKKLIDNKKLGGAICLIWKDGQIVFQENQGYRNMDTHEYPFPNCFHDETDYFSAGHDHIRREEIKSRRSDYEMVSPIQEYESPEKLVWGIRRCKPAHYCTGFTNTYSRFYI
jgi:hypothetical protein